MLITRKKKYKNHGESQLMFRRMTEDTDPENSGKLLQVSSAKFLNNNQFLLALPSKSFSCKE